MYKLYYIIFTTLFTFVVLTNYATATRNPYQVIGVQPGASPEEIKKAYRELARTLHPDKSQPGDNDASNRFAEINRAYGILKDPEKRRRYDQFGETESSRYSSSFRERRQNARPSGGGYRYSRGTFTFFTTPESRFKKISITSSQYYNEYLKESRTKVFLVFFFMDFCPSCNYIENDWFKITDTLKKYGVESFSINVNSESQLARNLGVSSIPYISALVDSQLYNYRQSEVSLTNFVKFIRTLLPKNLITTLQNEADQDRFIVQAPRINRLSAIIVQTESNLRFRYHLLAYEFRFNYKMGYISTRVGGHTLFCHKYNVSIPATTSSSQATMLVFDESLDKPRHTLIFDVSNNDISTLKKQLQEWPFLKLPRLISQYTFNDLCLYTIPKDGQKKFKRLCVILFASEASSSLLSRNKLIEFVESNRFGFNEKVVFMFIDPVRQADFVTDLLKETQANAQFSENNNIENSIMLIERSAQSPDRALYRWIENKWNAQNPDELDKAKLELYSQIIAYKKDPQSVLKSKVILTNLVDEEGPGLLERVYLRCYNQLARMLWYITSSDSFSSIVLIVLCALGGSLLFYQNPSNYMPNHLSREDINLDRAENNETKEHIDLDDDLRIVELKAETYNGMVRLFRPGCRSIILLADRETKNILLPQFRRAVWPYRRNKTLTFGYLCLDKNLGWFEALLQQVVGEENLHINKKNCVGTVLSLNGFKKYFRMYHAKHTEERLADTIFGVDQDSDDEIEHALLAGSQSSNNLLKVENLLDRLPIWLDKMFDGITKRYFIDNWPEQIL